MPLSWRTTDLLNHHTWKSRKRQENGANEKREETAHHAVPEK